MAIRRNPESRKMKVADLTPASYNPRKISDGAMKGLTASVERFGLVQPIVWNRRTERVVGGHQRLKVLVAEGIEETDVIVVDLPESEEKALNLALNNPSIAGEFTDDLDSLLAEVQADLPELFADLRLDELWQGVGDGTEGKTDPDSIPEPPDAAVSERGKVYGLGRHRLLCGDSGVAADVDRLIAGNPIHLACCDPPYNVRVEPRSNNAIAAGLSSFTGTTHHQGLDLARQPGKAQATHGKLRPKDRPLENDFVSEEAFEALLRAWFGNLARVLRPGRAFYLWGGYANCGNYPPVLKETGLYFSQAIIWDKEHPVLTRKDFMGAHEWCFYGWREGAAHEFFGPANAQDLWHVKKINPQSMVHLCLHPDSLVLTDAGYRPIRAIAIGDHVYGVDGRFHAVTNVSAHAYQSPDLVRIVAKGGNLATIASDNHPFLIWRPRKDGRRVVGGDVTWLRADEIRRGDYTMTPLLTEPEEDPLPERDEAFWFLFGLYLAQGSLQSAGHGENRYPTFHLHKKRQDLVAKIHDRWDSVGEYDPADYGERSQGVTVMAFDPDAGAAFEELGGRHSHAKRMAHLVFRLPRAKRLAVFQGWLSGDGCRVHDRSYWQGNTTSPCLAAHLQLLAGSVGYRANLFRYDPPVELGMINGRRIRSARPVYNLYFYARDPKVRRGTFTHVLHEDREYALRYVKSVERVPYSGEVLNLTVEGSHTFQTAVGVSHNTEKPVELATLAMQYSSRPGENVLDLFGGSGSTLIGAEMTGRRAFLMEIDALYCDVIRRRWAEFVNGEGCDWRALTPEVAP